LDRLVRAFSQNKNAELRPIEIAALGSWSPNSVPVYVSKLRERGFRIRWRSYRRTYMLDVSQWEEVRNTGDVVLQAARTVTLVPENDDSIFAGIPEDLEQFYQARAETLSEQN